MRQQQQFIISTPSSRQRGHGHFAIYANDADDAFATVERHMGHAVVGLRLEETRP